MVLRDLHFASLFAYLSQVYSRSEWPDWYLVSAAYTQQSQSYTSKGCNVMFNKKNWGCSHLWVDFHATALWLWQLLQFQRGNRMTPSTKRHGSILVLQLHNPVSFQTIIKSSPISFCFSNRSTCLRYYEQKCFSVLCNIQIQNVYLYFSFQYISGLRFFWKSKKSLDSIVISFLNFYLNKALGALVAILNEVDTEKFNHGPKQEQ